MAVGDSYTVSLLHFDNNLTDESGKTWTAYGGATTSDSQSKFGGYSGYFDGVDDGLVSTAHSDFAFGTSPFSVDCWIRIAALPTHYGTICGTYNNSYTETSWALGVTSAGKFRLATPQTALLTGTTTLSTNTWYHMACSFDGTTYRLFVNGTVDGYTTTTRDFSSVLDCCIGRNSDSTNTYYFNGYIDELRISKGIARWTANFTPPTAPYGRIVIPPAPICIF